ncbi:MAG TPA: C25 family cysteine peptidase, partial [Thermoanaerobaculia bacterium]|nr:C25 family cysteine peptidase [Thermoanaerobaculia bacterium]
LTSGGRPVPMWVEDGGDGSFDRGDRLIFVGGPALEGDGRRNTYARSNVYYLSAAAPGSSAPPARAADCVPAADLSGVARVEKEALRVRFAGAEDGADLWYWAKLSPLDPAPFAVPLELHGLDARAAAPVLLRVGLRGWSRLPGGLQAAAPDHRVELAWNGRALASHEWREADGAQVLEARLPAAEAGSAGSRLEVRVPERRVGEPPVPVVDVVLLDWVEIDYPHLPVLAAEQELLSGPAAAAGSCVPLASAAGERGWLYPVEAPPATDAAPAAARWRAVSGAGYRAVDRLELDRTSDLRRARRADLVMIAHPRLLAASAPLAELHRRRGLAVELVDIDDVYDEFSHGVAHPEPLRAFLRHTQCCWAAPAPRHVLLVGDASWDVSGQGNDQNYADWTYQEWAGAGFGKNASTSYPEPKLDRDLIPAGSYGSSEGPVASDNWFADVDGDELPDLAIGRLPVASEDEVASVVRKIAAYLADPDPGPWHSRLLWITNEFTPYQQMSDELAAAAAGRGFASRKIYPQSAEASNESHRQDLLTAWDEGQLLVHFIGHGGRYIWRTGPPDLKKNHDLLTLDDLDRLAPSSRFPVVLAMTCYSAPFDHPVADSIGEKLLRLPDKGAAAVVAASWRNSPSLEMSRALIEEMLAGGTIGEAVQRAKRRAGHPDLIRQYNLFGDPSLPIPLPAGGVDLRLAGGARPTVRGELRDGAAGRGAARVEWLDHSGAVVATQEVAAAGGVFEASLPEGVEVAALAGARAAVSGPAGRERVGAVALDGARLQSLYRNRVRWATASEVENYGFDVYRAEREEGPFVRLTERTIAGAGTTDTPRSYEFVDAPIDPSRVYFYYVESISLAGVRERFTPVERVGPKLPAPPKTE